MSYMKILVDNIIEMFEYGFHSEEIARQLNCDVRIVYDTINFFYDTKHESLH